MKRVCSTVSYVNNLKQFSDIPGPKSLPVIGTLWQYLPVIGKYKFNKLHINGVKKFKEFGPVVKEEIVPGVNLVWIYTPEDVQELFKKEGRYPERRSHLAVDKYRKDRNDIYNTGGLLPTNGPEWWKIRSVFQKGLSSPQNVKIYLAPVNDIIDEFLNHLDHEWMRKDKPEDFVPILSRLYLEIICMVAFDARLNSLCSSEMCSHSKSSLLMDAALTTNSCILNTDNGPQLWKYIDTPLYKLLKKSHQYMENTGMEFILKKIETLHPSDGHIPSLLDIYLNSEELDFKDIVGMSVDMILAGIDTTTYTSSFILYHLSQNLDVQEKLHEESKRLLYRVDTPVTSGILAQATYLKAVLKESFRLNPISVGIGRVLATDAVFSNYVVPKGTVVVTQNEVVCKFENYFKNAKEFIPERWIKNHALFEPVSPYLVLPFGHGPRTCIARRLAEQNIQTFILKLCRKYHVRWLGTKIQSESLLINRPDGPILLSLTKRE